MLSGAVHHPRIGRSHRVGGRSEGGMHEGVDFAHIFEGGVVNVPHLTTTNVMETS